MRIATAPVNWNNEDLPSYRSWTPYPRILKEMVHAGYRFTEWAASLPEDPDRLRADGAGLGLGFLGAFVGLALRDPSLREAELERAMKRAVFLKAIGATHLIAADSGDEKRRALAGHVSAEQGLDQEGWRSLTRGLDELGRRLEGLGLKLVVHNHVGTYVETAEETARVLEGTDPRYVGWCLDCGHLAYGGGDTLAMLEQYGERVAYVHLKDVDADVLARARGEGWGFHQALQAYVFAPLGQGMVQVEEVVHRLATLGYAGWAVIEQDTTPDDPTAIASANRSYLEEVLREV